MDPMGQPGSGVDVDIDADAQAAGRLPPGQRMQRGEWPVLHYGPVPRFKPDSWDFRVTGATVDGEEAVWFHEEFAALPTIDVTADFHCVTKFTMLDASWRGVTARTILALPPP